MIFLLHFKEKVYVYVLLFFNDSRSQFVAASSAFLNVVDVDVVFFVVDGVGFLAALLAAVLGAVGGGSLFNLKKVEIEFVSHLFLNNVKSCSVFLHRGR